MTSLDKEIQDLEKEVLKTQAKLFIVVLATIMLCGGFLLGIVWVLTR